MLRKRSVSAVVHSSGCCALKPHFFEKCVARMAKAARVADAVKLRFSCSSLSSPIKAACETISCLFSFAFFTLASSVYLMKFGPCRSANGFRAATSSLGSPPKRARSISRGNGYGQECT